jgi:NAD(P)-dependent dehydrogenase (short-subunit alcohol dehydrogenase family)
MATEKKVAFVTGGNRGIGLETARQLGKQGVKVVIGSRDLEKGNAVAEKLRGEGADVRCDSF